MKYLELTVGAALVYNFVLSRFLGICPFLGVSKRLDTAMGMSGAVIFVMTLASGATALNVPFKGQQGSRSCIPDPPEESGLFKRVMNGLPRHGSLGAH